ncbi:MAG TPA: hypothetical protein VEQ38_03905 [Verrucomicrobiae bacterium]|nr:hypothetical protein [Verrucomicrobiae bacterium]
MKEQKLIIWVAATTLGLALFIGGCGEKKAGDEAPQTSSATPPAPMSEKSPGDQPGVSQGSGSDTGMPGTAQGQKPDEKKDDSSQKG